jgi:hypothetical protein
MSSMTGNLDPYLYPGTNVLKNLRGLTDPEPLARFEARRTHRRIAESIDTPVTGRFDLAHLKAIHRYTAEKLTPDNYLEAHTPQTIAPSSILTSSRGLKTPSLAACHSA